MPDTLCPECGSVVPPRDRAKGGRPQLFCSPAHKKAFNNLMIQRGYALVPLMQTWRGGRRKGADKQLAAYAFREACALLGDYARADAEAGRDPSRTVAGKEAQGWSAHDLEWNKRRKA